MEEEGGCREVGREELEEEGGCREVGRAGAGVEKAGSWRRLRRKGRELEKVEERRDWR